MKVVFMGTSEFAVPSLTKIIEAGYPVIGVVTQPDRPSGRGKKLKPSPVKETASGLGLQVFQPQRIREEDAIEVIRNWGADLIVVVSFGQILPPEILDLPRLGCINLHASLLPHYRGAAPIQRAIMAGDKVTGVTTMFMDAGLDTGDIILQKPVEIEEDLEHGQISDLLAQVGAEILIDTMAIIASGSTPRRKQDNHRSNYAPMLTRADEKIDWNRDAGAIRNQIRALSPHPAAYTSLGEHHFKIYKSRVVDKDAVGAPGQVTAITPDGFQVQTSKGILEILEVQRPGKKRISSHEFLKGYRMLPGDMLG